MDTSLLSHVCFATTFSLSLFFFFIFLTVSFFQPLNGHEFEQTLGDSEGQGSLVC